MMSKIKIYSSKEWLLPNKLHTIMLYPFWGEIAIDPLDPDFDRFSEYVTNGNHFFELINTIENSDLVIYPSEFLPDNKSIDHIMHIAEFVKQKNRKLIVFYNADDDATYEIDNVVFFRTSYYKSLQQANTFSFPGWSIDFKKYFESEEITFISNINMPSVSYCGYVDYIDDTFINALKSSFKHKKSFEDYAKSIRGKAVRRLKKNRKINSYFIIRNGFWAQGIDDKLKARTEYASNMQQALYSIATRGGGNFSYRLYEILSCGRIPIFINTDAILPFDEIIDWKKHVVFVEVSELNNIDSILLNYHASKTEKELIDIQVGNRKLYEDFISPLGFFRNIKLLIN